MYQHAAQFSMLVAFSGHIDAVKKVYHLTNMNNPIIQSDLNMSVWK